MLTIYEFFQFFIFFVILFGCISLLIYNSHEYLKTNTCGNWYIIKLYHGQLMVEKCSNEENTDNK